MWDIEINTIKFSRKFYCQLTNFCNTGAEDTGTDNEDDRH